MIQTLTRTFASLALVGLLVSLAGNAWLFKSLQNREQLIEQQGSVITGQNEAMKQLEQNAALALEASTALAGERQRNLRDLRSFYETLQKTHHPVLECDLDDQLIRLLPPD